eukprot:scaffold77567_cov21-Tisochrysis_lutea.AAC.1
MVRVDEIVGRCIPPKAPQGVHCVAAAFCTSPVCTGRDLRVLCTHVPSGSKGGMRRGMRGGMRHGMRGEMRPACGLRVAWGGMRRGMRGGMRPACGLRF